MLRDARMTRGPFPVLAARGIQMRSDAKLRLHKREPLCGRKFCFLETRIQRPSLAHAFDRLSVHRTAMPSLRCGRALGLRELNRPRTKMSHPVRDTDGPANWD